MNFGKKLVAVRKNNNFALQNAHYHWLKFQKKWVILGLAFIPYLHLVPGLGTALIVSTKLLNLKYGVLFLLAGNAVSWTVVAYHIYQGVNLFL